MLAIIITAYKPDVQLVDQFRPLLTECDLILIVDNTPNGSDVLGNLPAGFILLQNGLNSGLAHALNAGIDHVRSVGATTVMLFDQDSSPSPMFVKRMLTAFKEAKRKYGECCCLGPFHFDDTYHESPAIYNLDSKNKFGLEVVTCLPTSGLMFDIIQLAPSDQFSVDFFLDLVDFDWCWRLRAKGWSIIRSHAIHMPHRLGISEQRFFHLIYYVPEPYRHYFQVRDTLRIVLRPYVPWYSRIRLLGVLPIKAIVYPILLDRGGERLSWMCRGVIDAVRGIGGIGAARSRLSK